MASFTDKAPTFNPYVQQLPVDAMAMVGMQKQQQYDTNVQKITDHIQKIGGLDVLRDVDKTYLQSKLNELGNNLRNFAASDFSNFQLTNNTIGMVSNVAKDKHVLNAVNSTAKYRKVSDLRDKLTEEGKGSASRDWLLNLETNNWLESNDLNTKFTGNYKPFKDYSKSAQEVIKNLAKDYTENDVAFGDNGELLDAVTRTKIEGISPEKIQTALKAGLSADDWEQMQVDGRYKYANTSEEDFRGSIESNYKKTSETLGAKKKSLEDLASMAKSAQEKSRLLEDANSLDRLIKNNDLEFRNISGFIDEGNLEAAKATLFTNQWMNNMSNSFSSKSVSQVYEKSHFAERQHARDKMRQDLLIENNRMKMEERKLLSSEKQKELDRQNAREIAGAKAGAKPGAGGSIFGIVTMPTDSKATKPGDVIANANGNILETQKEVDDYKAILKQKLGVKSDTDFLSRYEAYKENPGAITGDVAKTFARYDDALHMLDQLNITRDRLRKESEILYPEVPEQIGIPDDKYEKTLNFQEADKFMNPIEGMEGSFNVVEAAYKINDFKKMGFKSGIKSPETYARAEEMVERGQMSPEDYKLLRVWISGGGGFTDPHRTRSAMNEVNQVARQISNYENALNKKRDEYVSEEYIKRTAVAVEQTEILPLANSAIASEVDGVIGMLAELKDRGGLEKDNPKFKEISSFVNNTEVMLVSTNGADINNFVFKKKGGESITVEVSRQQFLDVTKGRYESSPYTKQFNQKYLPALLDTPSVIEQTAEVVTADTFKNAEQAMAQGYQQLEDGRFYKENLTKTERGYYTTATDGEYKTTPENSRLAGKRDFPNVEHYVITGNLLTDSKPTETKELVLKINVFDPVTGQYIVTDHNPGFENDDVNIMQTLRDMTDEHIFHNIYGRRPTKEELIELKNAAQKIRVVNDN